MSQFQVCRGRVSRFTSQINLAKTNSFFVNCSSAIISALLHTLIPSKFSLGECVLSPRIFFSRWISQQKRGLKACVLFLLFWGPRTFPDFAHGMLFPGVTKLFQDEPETSKKRKQKNATQPRSRARSIRNGKRIVFLDFQEPLFSPPIFEDANAPERELRHTRAIMPLAITMQLKQWAIWWECFITCYICKHSCIIIEVKMQNL